MLLSKPKAEGETLEALFCFITGELNMDVRAEPTRAILSVKDEFRRTSMALGISLEVTLPKVTSLEPAEDDVIAHAGSRMLPVETLTDPGLAVTGLPRSPPAADSSTTAARILAWRRS